ncbi:MAG: aquaporin [Gaiellales bacterium]
MASPTRLSSSRGRPEPRPGWPPWEIGLTFSLLLVITAVATDTRAVGQAAALAIGGTVALGALVGGPISGASMNPARSLGPAIVSADLTGIWIYLLAPVLGSVAAAVVYRLLREVERTDPIT